MLVRDLLVGHLDATYQNESWQPSVVDAIAGLNAAQAGWKPGPDRNSVWQVVRHLARWKRYAIAWLDGESPDGAQYASGDWVQPTGGDAAWQADIADLRDVSAQLRERVSALPEDGRLASTGLGERGAAAFVLEVGAHDAYHAGQIRVLRALQGV